MAVTLDREQIRLVRQFKREARQRGYDPRERRRFVNTAIQTGLVEQGLHNRRGGDADSENWRQERRQGYGAEWARTGGPLNIGASVDRFADEYEQFADPGERSFEIAPQIQRPAAQFRGRYRERAAEANAIRRGVTLNGRAPRAGGSGGTGMPALDAGPVLALGAQPTSPEALVPGSTLAAPAHSARPVMPEGFQEAGGQAPAARVSLSDRLAQTAIPGADVEFGGPVGARDARRAAREAAGKGGVQASTAEGLADEISAWAKDALGLSAGSRDRDRAGNAAVDGAEDSDHLEDDGVGQGREAVDLPTTADQGGWGQYRRTVRRLGGKPSPDGFSEFQVKIGDRRFKVQVIFGEKHGHGDHIHAGFRRIK